jgi:hypothetical protein
LNLLLFGRANQSAKAEVTNTAQHAEQDQPDGIAEKNFRAGGSKRGQGAPIYRLNENDSRAALAGAEVSVPAISVRAESASSAEKPYLEPGRKQTRHALEIGNCQEWQEYFRNRTVGYEKLPLTAGRTNGGLKLFSPRDQRFG